MEQEELLTTIIESLLEEDALVNDAEWDTVSVLVAVTPSVTDLSAFRYAAAGRRGQPTPVRATNLRLFRELQAATAGPDGALWKVCIIKIERDSALGSVNFVYGDDEAEIWRITPATLEALVENLRPQPADFAR
jgi:hypothetical protein